ncbi:class I SAM-dependent methyltransferase [Brachybacterium saurashtrense]|uniref:Class I SAM-dependent methyltransferase n=1 Tax=Brachybacterium saurashtrense TaxID=556288 RepID=A0A345YS37_9MICO|nr:class I SAM-dependent methyltransferase [Brachybacterium saurashtrense]AXK46739.1 class I SAM-dependent methyltransferase [Brachybacterium saurashtrense]RRR22454.1 class I SAM-dependent methyltransferase [Brachybacterium saurashtrense]
MTAHHAHGSAPHSQPDPSLSPAEHWEQRYSGSERVWSGTVNGTMAQVVAELEPGISIDLGCGEGGDVLWLAEQGWTARGLDISATAIERARAEAAGRGLEQALFTATDLSAWQPEAESVDLVTASFFQSQVALDRLGILQRAASALRTGGHLVTVSHAAPPSWAAEHPAAMIDVRAEVEQLAQPAADWAVELAEERRRPAVGPDGTEGEHLDAVVVLRRR